MKKGFVALACLALLAVACSSDSSSNTAGPEDSTESVNSSSDATSASSSDSVEVDEDSTSIKVYVTSTYDDEEDDPVEVDEPESSSSSSKKRSSRSSSSKARSKSSSSAVVVPASSSSVELSSSAVEDSLDWRQTCLDVINEYRATENLGPISLAPEEKQTCTDKQAADDLADGKGHAHFQACKEMAQNTGPNVNMRYYKTYDEIVKKYLKMMWEDEKALVTSGERDPDKDEDFRYIGHYLNMKGSYRTVSCGIAVSEDGQTGWLNVDFYP